MSANNHIYHIHHIIPKHRWKELYGSLDGINVPWNTIRLTISEHAEYHKKLWKEFGRWQDEYAWNYLSGLIGKDLVLKEIYKQNGLKRIGIKQSVETQDKKRIKLKGIPLSKETKKKMSEAAKKRCQNPLEKKRLQKMANNWLGKHHKTESKIKISQANKGQNLGGKLSQSTKDKIRQSMILFGQRKKINRAIQMDSLH